MTWDEAELNLLENIHINDHLDGFGHYKIVVKVPHNSNDYFRIKVGANNYINISMQMLQIIFIRSEQNNRVYDRNIFKNLFPNEYSNKSCYVHAIGKLFVHANVAIVISKRTYKIL